ncbi:MAG TPA: class I SAM-dependent methyltransferase [Acidiferrobacterales bacterium]
MQSDFWDQRYAGEDYAYGTEPNAFLVSQAGRLAPGLRVLAVGEGEGRNAVWLAGRGLEVLAVDGSVVGLAKARALAAERGVSIATEHADLTAWRWPRAGFDAVIAIFVHFPPAERARMHAAMFAALKPGGLLILEAFTPEQLQYRTGGPPVRGMLYDAAMLRGDFPGAEIVLLEETLADVREGAYHHGRAAVVRAVLRRPSGSAQRS